jgi:hypothetical protein
MVITSLKQTPFWLLGSILGDTHINNYGCLSISHSIKQKDYFLLKYQKLKDLNVLSLHRQSTYYEYSHLDLRTNNVYTKLTITTLSHFLFLRNFFYPNGIKIVPKDLIPFFNAESLAFWYMDDGGRNSIHGRGMSIDISCFTIWDQELLKNMMETKFLCQVTFHRRSPKNTKLYIKTSSALHFCNLIRPYIIPSMLYKLTC